MLSKLKKFVEKHKEDFAGSCNETPENISLFEEKLGWKLPESLTWLLTNCGYSDYSCVSNLEEAIEQTIELRKSIKLPKHILLLNDDGDAGIVIIENLADSYRVIYTDTGDLYSIIDGASPSENADIYDNFASFVIDMYDDLKE